MTTQLTTHQVAENKYKIGVDMIKEGMAGHNPGLIRGGILFLKTAASINDQAKHCLSRLKATANPAASHLVALQDPCNIQFSNAEINRLCEAKTAQQQQQYTHS